MVQIHSPRPLSVGVRPGDMGDSSYRRHGLHFWAERVVEWFEHPRLQIEVPQIIIHKADQPDVVVHFLDTDGLPGEDLAEIERRPRYFPRRAA